jgi:putative DNA primase/helicase
LTNHIASPGTGVDGREILQMSDFIKAPFDLHEQDHATSDDLGSPTAENRGIDEPSTSSVSGSRSADEPKYQIGTRRRREPRHKPPDLSELTDEGNARRFVDLNHNSIRYCPAWGWIFYDGKRWGRDNSLEVERRGRATFQWLGEQSGRIKDPSERLSYNAAVKGFRSASALTAMLKLARSDARIGVTPDVFDRDPFLLNCPNGTIDLRTGALRVHDPRDYLTKLGVVDFVPGVACPTWDAFIGRVMDGDGGMIGYLRRAAGYALSGDTSEQCLFLLHGHGSNGKSVLLETILYVLGDYAMKAQSHLLTSAGRSHHATTIADLDGMRFVAISEPSGGRFDEAQLKALIGDETIRANRMHRDSYQFTATHKFFMATNHKPRVEEMNTAFWRRIRFIKFDVTIPPDQQDRRLLERLRGEASGILSWMVKGCLEWQAEGLNEPEKVRQATADYREEMDPIVCFLDACCVRGPDLRVGSSKLWATYQKWADEEGMASHGRIANLTCFGTLLAQHGHDSMKTGGTMVRRGLALKPIPGSQTTGEDSNLEETGSGR